MADTQKAALLASLPAPKPKQLAPLVGARPIPKAAVKSAVPWELPTIAKTPADIIKLARQEVSTEHVLDAPLPGSIDNELQRPKTPESASSSKHSRGRRSTVGAKLEESVPNIDVTSHRRNSPVDTSFLSQNSSGSAPASSRKLSLPPANPKEHGVVESDSEIDKELLDSLFRAGRQSNHKQVAMSRSTIHLLKWLQVIETLDKHSYLDIDVRDEFQNTLLIVAASQNCKRLLKECLRRGADINAQNWQGNTAAHQAFRFRYHDLGNYILEKGANVMLSNEEGHSVLSFAEHSAERIAKEEEKSK